MRNKHELTLWLVVMKQKVVLRALAPVQFKPDTHSRSFSAFSGKCCLLTFPFFVIVGFCGVGGVFLACVPLFRHLIRGANAPEALAVLHFGLCAAAAPWVHKGALQCFKPLSLFFSGGKLCVT